MRLRIDHSFEIALGRVRPRATLALRVTPEDAHDQNVAGWRIGLDRDARLKPGRDGYGNRLTMVYAEGPLDRLCVHLTGEVLTGPSSGVIPAGREPLPPGLFLRQTAASQPDAAGEAFARAAIGDAADMIERLHLLNVALHRAFPLDEAALPAGGSGAAFACATLGSADAAQLFAGLARALGHPARCVAGWRGEGRAIAPAHWAEAHDPALGWIGFDPATGLSTGESYARVATALDVSGTAMVAGR